MNNKHTQYFYGCAIPSAIGEDYYETPDSTTSGHPMIINGPPEDARCMVCQRHISDLEPFVVPGDPRTEHYAGVKLIKRFRKDRDGCIGASWECRDCVERSDGEWKVEEEDRLRQTIDSLAESVDIAVEKFDGDNEFVSSIVSVSRTVKVQDKQRWLTRQARSIRRWLTSC